MVSRLRTNESITIRILFLVILLVIPLSCVRADSNSNETDNNNRTEHEIFSQDPVPSTNDYYTFLRNRASKVLTIQQSEMLESTNNFSWLFFQDFIQEQEGSSVCSPLSLVFILGLLSEGAGGETLEELLNVFGTDRNNPHVISDFCLNLKVLTEEIDSSTDLSFANGIIVDDRFPIYDSYIQRTKEYYDALVVNLDFSRENEVLAFINDWVAFHSSGIFDGILQAIDSGAAAYILDAVYFNATWRTPFPKDRSTEYVFTKEDGSACPVIGMSTTLDKLPYTENEDYQAIRLDYGDGHYSMSVVLPQKGKTIQDIKVLPSADDFNLNLVSLIIPKFEITNSFQAEQILEHMGLEHLLNAADFSRISENHVNLNRIIQNTHITVSETGTTATAATIAELEPVSDAPDPTMKYFHALQPFVFYITEQTTGALLFIGVYKG